MKSEGSLAKTGLPILDNLLVPQDGKASKPAGPLSKDTLSHGGSFFAQGK